MTPPIPFGLLRPVVSFAPRLDRLNLPGAAETGRPAHFRQVLYAARSANLLSEDVALGPACASVIPLPHQLKALRRAVQAENAP